MVHFKELRITCLLMKRACWLIYLVVLFYSGMQWFVYCFFSQTYTIIISIILFIAMIKLLRLLSFNKRIASFSRTLKYTSKPLLNFMIVFTGCYMPFTMMAHMFFGRVEYSYATWRQAFQALFILILGTKHFRYCRIVRAGISLNAKCSVGQHFTCEDSIFAI